jgi:hypothetical protein
MSAILSIFEHYSVIFAAFRAILRCFEVFFEVKTVPGVDFRIKNARKSIDLKVNNHIKDENKRCMFSMKKTANSAIFHRFFSRVLRSHKTAPGVDFRHKNAQKTQVFTRKKTRQNRP